MRQRKGRKVSQNWWKLLGMCWTRQTYMNSSICNRPSLLVSAACMSCAIWSSLNFVFGISRRKFLSSSGDMWPSLFSSAAYQDWWWRCLVRVSIHWKEVCASVRREELLPHIQMLYVIRPHTLTLKRPALYTTSPVNVAGKPFMKFSQFCLVWLLPLCSDRKSGSPKLQRWKELGFLWNLWITLLLYLDVLEPLA